MDFEKFKATLLDATRQCLIESQDKYKAETLTSFSLSAVLLASGIYADVNTLAFNKTMTSGKSDEVVNHLKWYSPEWAYIYEGVRDIFADLTKMSNQGLMNCPDEESDKIFRNKVYEICVQVLEELRHEESFSSYLFLFSPEENGYENELKQWAARLNPSEDMDAFERYMSASARLEKTRSEWAEKVEI